MTKKIVVCLALVSMLALGGEAAAEICTIDDVPAATLLLPYFEVDLDPDGNGVLCDDNGSGVNTLFSVNNASAAATLAHVTFWTDMSVPVLDFDVYLTGFDVQTISIRDILCDGNLPQTLIADLDGNNATGEAGVSNEGENISNPAQQSTAGFNPQDPLGAFSGSSGPCVGTYDPLPGSFLDGHLIPALTGGESSINSCVGSSYGDDVARGYVTVDVVTECNLDFPSTPGYFSGTAGFDNILWGDYFYVDTANDFAQGETLVHIEACPDPSVGNGAGWCPFVQDDFTFYSRYVSNTGVDQREGLSSQFAARYVGTLGLDEAGQPLPGGTDYIVWRDSRSNQTTNPLGICPADLLPPSNAFDWYPLNQALVVCFDEQENHEERCFVESDVSPPTGGVQTCFPIEAGRYSLEDSIVPNSQSVNPTPDFGWCYLDLDLTEADTPSSESQAWVTVVMDALGRFSVGFDAIQLDSVCDTLNIPN